NFSPCGKRFDEFTSADALYLSFTAARVVCLLILLKRLNEQASLDWDRAAPLHGGSCARSAQPHQSAAGTKPRSRDGDHAIHGPPPGYHTCTARTRRAARTCLGAERGLRSARRRGS